MGAKSINRARKAAKGVVPKKAPKKTKKVEEEEEESSSSSSSSSVSSTNEDEVEKKKDSRKSKALGVRKPYKFKRSTLAKRKHRYMSVGKGSVGFCVKPRRIGRLFRDQLIADTIRHAHSLSKNADDTPKRRRMSTKVQVPLARVIDATLNEIVKQASEIARYRQGKVATGSGLKCKGDDLKLAWKLYCQNRQN